MRTVRSAMPLSPSHPRCPSSLPQHPGSKEAAAIGERMAEEGKAAQAPEATASDLQIDESAFFAGDLALLLLDSPIFSLAPVGLASESDWEAVAQAGLELRSIGWGAMSEARSSRAYPSRLQETPLPLVSDRR